MAHLNLSSAASSAAEGVRPGLATVRRYDDRGLAAAGMFEAAATAERPSTELLRLVLSAAISLLDIETAVICDAEGGVVAVAPENEASYESARPFARAAIRAVESDELPDGLYVARLTEAPAAFIALRWRAGAVRRIEVANALATTCASLLHRDERVYRSGDVLSDGLTGLALRMPTLHQLERAIHAASRAGRHCGFLFIDLDGFKGVNDAFGHAAGDRVLAEAGRRMRACVRRGDTAGRIGGDEFGVIVAMHEGENELLEAAERLLGALRLKAGDHGLTREVTASIGIAIFPEDGATAQELVEHADAAMYVAKRSGGDAVRFYRDGSSEDPRARRTIGTAYAQIERDRDLLVCYQPLADVATREVRAVEALVRWRHPTQGWLSPSALGNEFAAHADAVEIDLWVLHTALAGLRRAATETLSLHVNLAAADERIADAIEALPEHEARRLAIEVSEATLLAAPEPVANLFARIQATGATVGIERFGQRRVSVEALCAHPLDFVKIDRRLTRDAGTERGLRLFRAAVDLVRRFDARAIAEGVEHFEHAAAVANSGVSALQGYAFGQPMTAPDLADWLTSERTATASGW